MGLPLNSIRTTDIGLNAVPPVGPWLASLKLLLLDSTDPEIREYATSMSAIAVKNMESRPRRAYKGCLRWEA